MASYHTSVRTPMTPAAAFAYMADLRNFAAWDPGVKRVVQVAGDGGGPDAVFDVTVAGIGRDLTLRYRTLDHQAPERLIVRADSRLFSSVDEITVVPDGEGSVVTYDAELRLQGPLGVFDPVLKLAFGRIGDRAASGLRRALQGDDVDASGRTR